MNYNQNYSKDIFDKPILGSSLKCNPNFLLLKCSYQFDFYLKFRLLVSKQLAIFQIHQDLAILSKNFHLISNDEQFVHLILIFNWDFS